MDLHFIAMQIVHSTFLSFGRIRHEYQPLRSEIFMRLAFWQTILFNYFLNRPVHLLVGWLVGWSIVHSVGYVGWLLHRLCVFVIIS